MDRAFGMFGREEKHVAFQWEDLKERKFWKTRCRQEDIVKCILTLMSATGSAAHYGTG